MISNLEIDNQTLNQMLGYKSSKNTYVSKKYRQIEFPCNDYLGEKKNSGSKMKTIYPLCS